MSRSTSNCGAATSRRGFAAADHVFEHSLPHPAGDAHAARAHRLGRRAPALPRSPSTPRRRSPSFVRIEIARLLGLAGEPRARQGAVSRRRLRRQALHQARGAGGGAGAAGPPAGEDRAHHGRAVLHHHASTPATFRIKSGVAKDGRIVARRCEVWWNGGAYADIGPRVTQKSGFTAAGPYDIENVAHRFLRRLYQPPAGRRAARLRHSAARLGL